MSCFCKTISVITIDNIDENTAMDKIRLYLWPPVALSFLVRSVVVTEVTFIAAQRVQLEGNTGGK